jgi:hypothetical protein
MTLTLEAIQTTDDDEKLLQLLLFVAAWEIVKPYLDEIRTRDWKGAAFSDFLERTGIQVKTDLLSERMWQISKEQGKLGLMAYWIRYARKYPERCIHPA